jgi:hypothetical protein
MIEHMSFNQLTAPDHGSLKIRRHFSSDDDQGARRVGSAMITCLATALRGLLVTTAALTTVAYLLLTNSHI